MKRFVSLSIALIACLAFAPLSGCKTKEAPEPVSPTVNPSDPGAIQSATNNAAAPSGNGYTTTYSGLQYKVLREGTGKRPGTYNKVKVHYHGTLLNGTVFDSSIQRGQPIVFGVTQVIPGWTEGLQLMKEGAKYAFIIPPHIAYGQRGAPPKIGPNETLKFDVELIEVLY